MRYVNLQSLAEVLSIQAVLYSGVASFEAEKRDFDVFDYVNPLIGTINGGELKSLQGCLSELIEFKVTCFQERRCHLVC